ncbi:MAG TPA: ABC transporter permease subunit [Gemmatimonadales bacterium]|nr:ABC transporter permease subunit [Gemmatimonadales bacterium]
MTPRVSLLVRRELATAVRARWFVAYSGVFLVGGLLLATIGLENQTVYGFRGFARAFAGLAQLALLLVPVMALFPAAAAIAEDRESGALEYVLAQPITYGELYLGKLAGVTLALLLSLTVGFGVSGAVAVGRGVPPGLVAALYAFVALLACTFTALGVGLSGIAASRARAMTVGVIAWLALSALGTLGIVIVFIRWGVPEPVLVMWSFINPVEAFRLGIISVLDPDLSLLGPVGAGIVRRLGTAGTSLLGAASLTVWTIVSAVGGFQLSRQPSAQA